MNETLLEIEYALCSSCDSTIEDFLRGHNLPIENRQDELVRLELLNKLLKEKEKSMCISFYNYRDEEINICMKCLGDFLMSNETELKAKYIQNINFYG